MINLSFEITDIKKPISKEIGFFRFSTGDFSRREYQNFGG